MPQRASSGGMTDQIFPEPGGLNLPQRCGSSIYRLGTRIHESGWRKPSGPETTWAYCRLHGTDYNVDFGVCLVSVSGGHRRELEALVRQDLHILQPVCPQGLKPMCFGGLCGTVKTVPSSSQHLFLRPFANSLRVFDSSACGGLAQDLRQGLRDEWAAEGICEISPSD